MRHLGFRLRVTDWDIVGVLQALGQAGQIRLLFSGYLRFFVTRLPWKTPELWLFFHETFCPLIRLYR